MSLYKVLISILNVIFRLFYRIEVKGKDNIPKENSFLLCSNHINILDPIILSMIIPREISWMGKKELFENKFLNWLFRKIGAFPIDRDEPQMSSIRHSIKILKNKGVLGIFPEGTRVKEMNLENAKPGVALISIKSESEILPVYIEGNYRPFSKIKIYIGKGFEFSSAYNNRITTGDYKKYGQEILTCIYSLKSK